MSETMDGFADIDIYKNKLAVNILESITDAFFSLDLDWRFIYVNNEAENLLGKTREQLIGKSVWDEFPEALDSTFYKEYSKAMNEQKTVIFEEFFPPLNTWFSVRAFPSKTSLLVYFQNINEKKLNEKEIENLLELEKKAKARAEELTVHLKEQQKAIQENEEKFRLLSEALPQMVWSGDNTGYIDYYNRAWYEYTGLTFTQIKQGEWVNIFHHDDLDEVNYIWGNSVKQGHPFELKCRMKRHSDGTFRWHISRGVPMKNEAGEIVRWFGTCADIDEQVRSELTQKFLAEAGNLLSSSLEYETTLQNIAKMAVPEFADWVSVDVVRNNQIERLAVAHQDESKVELAKQMFIKFRPKLDDPTGLPNVIRTGVSELVEYLPPSVFDNIPFDEETKQIFRNLSLNSFMIIPLKIEENTIGGISFVREKYNSCYTKKDLEVAEDLGRRASMAIHNAYLYQKSREVEESFRFLSESIPQQVWTSLPDGSLDYVNQRVINFFDKPHDEIIGQGWQSVIHPDDLAATVERWTNSLTKHVDYETEFRLLNTKENKYRWHIGRAIPFKNEKGEVVKWFGTNTDIHELKEAEENLARKSNELENSNNELKNFAYVASHDLQEPLRTMSSYAALIHRRNKDLLSEESIEFIGLIIDAAKRMKKLIEDLLDYSQVGKQEMVKVDLNETIKSILFNLKVIIQENNVSIYYDNLPSVLAVPSQMMQLFQNIISNAIKYRAKEDPVINIKVQESNNEFVFSVSDNGIGINKDYYQKIFIIFQRLHDKDKYEGTGIGLATCKKIIDLHNGKIWLESEEGKGTTFYFSLPK